jgi:GTP cyclohydrolase I
MTSEKMNKIEKIEAMEAVRTLLRYAGDNPDREGLAETPHRVTKMYGEVFGGYKQDYKQILSKTFKDEEHKEMVIVKDIPYYSHCEHHMVPFFGKVHIGYIPNGEVVGLSKFARLVECFARRLQIQERMTSQIADAIVECLKPLGVIVVVEGEHLCMSMRGVQKPGTSTTTAAIRGVFKDNQAAREDFELLME